jgi:hypothetical protein
MGDITYIDITYIDITYIDMEPYSEGHKAFLPHPPHSGYWVCSVRQALSLASLALLVQGLHPFYYNMLFEHP